MMLYTSCSTGYGDSNDYSHCRVDSGISQLIGQIVKLAKVNSNDYTNSNDYSQTKVDSHGIAKASFVQIIQLALVDDALIIALVIALVTVIAMITVIIEWTVEYPN